jgi:hypothetical protein
MTGFRAGLLSLLALAALTGCAGAVRRGSAPAPRVERGPAPTYEEVARRYNERVEPLTSLWSRCVVRIWFPDREGEERTEQVEGHLQYIRPDRVDLTLRKVGQPVAALGCNAEKYWWIELAQEKSRKAYVGTHAGVDPERIARLGLPVYPLDLIELTGITPLPTLAARGPDAPRVRWSPDGSELVLELPQREGARRVALDPETFDPVRVEVLDGSGRVLLSSMLSEYQTVGMRGGLPGTARSRVPGEVLASVNQGRTRVRMRIYDPETGASRPKPAAFDLNRLLDVYGVQNVIDLDRDPVALR